MKTVIIHGQDHTSGSSCTISRKIAEKVSGKDERTEFFLPRDLDHRCTGCLVCIDNEEGCPLYQDKKRIMDAVMDAELIIITTPNYCMHASSSIKSFMELTFTNWMPHRPKAEMFRKKALVVATTAGMGAGKAIKDVTGMLSWWGISKIWKYGLAVQASGWKNIDARKRVKIEKDIDKISERINSSGRAKTSLKTRCLFMIMRMMQKKGMGSSEKERKYWEDNGWLRSARPW